MLGSSTLLTSRDLLWQLQDRELLAVESLEPNSYRKCSTWSVSRVSKSISYSPKLQILVWIIALHSTIKWCGPLLAESAGSIIFYFNASEVVPESSLQCLDRNSVSILSLYSYPHSDIFSPLSGSSILPVCPSGGSGIFLFACFWSLMICLSLLAASFIRSFLSEVFLTVLFTFLF